ncbi:hypothetical protein FB45DRAFT_930563 [Roridomyces roridus]|uniref:Uncharacterized protein n=1 Tax=Roridomyces roridus TaxID=1738132 RepID=A0AAD7BFA0_9AGAR|nr:hypothetical protein FB45DRAFT_930563 [Roridomyces roridus]
MSLHPTTGTLKRKRDGDNVQRILKTFADFESEGVVLTQSFKEKFLRQLLGSVPFTNASAYFPVLFGKRIASIRVDTTLPAVQTVYHQTAAALLQNPAWNMFVHHVITDRKQVVSRTSIDLVLLYAVRLAQDLIEKDPVLDRKLAESHQVSVPQRQWLDSATWLTLWQSQELPAQNLGPVEMYGRFDYLVAVLDRAHCDVSRSPPCTEFMSAAEVHAGLDHIDILRCGSAAAVTVTATHTMTDESMVVQTLCQGAAACIFTGRTSFVNALTDGRKWRFFEVKKRTNDADPTPFSCKQILLLDIFNPKHTSLIIRLLTISILYPDEFAKRASQDDGVMGA